MKEQRKMKRRHIMFYSRVFDRKTGKLIGYLGDITAKGIMIISEYPLEVDIDHLLRMDLPIAIYSKALINFEVRSVWRRPDIDPNFYNTGFQLSNTSQEDIAIIERIVEDYGFRD